MARGKKKGFKPNTYAGGGNLKNIAGDFLRADADMYLSMLGMGNIIPDNAYNNAKVGKITNAIGSVTKNVLPTALNIVAPGSGNAISGLQNVGATLTPEQVQQNAQLNQPNQFPNGGNLPTFQDSLALYNNARAVNNFYGKNKDYIVANIQNVKDNWANNLEDAVKTYDLETHRDGLISKGAKDIPKSQYYNKVNNNQFKQREIANSILNTEAPISLYDKRIKPQYYKEYFNTNLDSKYGADEAGLYMYDPLAMKPWSMMTDKEKQLRIKKYGNTGTPNQSNSNASSNVNTDKKPTYYGTTMQNGVPQPINSTISQMPVYDPSLQASYKPVPQQPQPQPQNTTASQAGRTIYNNDGTAVIKKGRPVLPAYLQGPDITQAQREQYWATHDAAGNPIPTGNINTYVKPQTRAYGGSLRNAGSNATKTIHDKSLWNQNMASGDKDFQNWYNKNTIEGKNNIPYSDNLDYDYYSYYKNNDYKSYQGGHFPDTYKKPNHQTFSNESMYSTPENPGGHWNGDTYIPYKNNGGYISSIHDVYKGIPFANGGNLTRYENGGTHEENMYGGVPVGQSLVEQGETRKDDYIFSDRLKVKGSNMTFADKSKRIENSYKNMTDPLRMEAKDRRLNQLRDHQEEVRSTMIDNEIQKANGGSIHIKPSHKGRFTAYKQRTGKTTEEALHSKNPHVRQMANFARNAAKFKHPYGGTLYPDQQLNLVPNGTDPFTSWANNLPEMIGPYNSQPIPVRTPNQTVGINPTIQGDIQSLDQVKTINPTMNTQAPLQGKLPYWAMGAQALAPLSELYYGLKGGDPVNFQRVKAETLNPAAAKQSADIALQRAYNSGNSDLRNNNLTSSQYRSNRLVSAGAEGLKRAQTSADIQQQYDLNNAQIRNNNNAINAQIAMNESIARQQEKDAARSYVTTGLSDLGSVGAGISKDTALNNIQNMILKGLSTGEYMIDQTGQVVKIKKYGGKLRMGKSC